MQRITASVKFQRCNSLQIPEVTASLVRKRLYATVTGQSQRIRKRP